MKILLRSIWPPSIRWQLVAWYTAVFAMLLLGTGAFFYRHLETSLEASLDTTLQVRAQQIASELVLTNGVITLHDLAVNPSGTPPDTQGRWFQRDNVEYGELVRLLDARGHVLSETPAFRVISAPSASITQPLQGAPWQGTVLTAGNREIRLFSRTFTQHHHAVAVIQVGESLTALQALLQELVEELLLVGALVLLVCAWGSYWLAARSFAPIQHLARTARRIQAGDLHQRVPVPTAHDEIQYLALTLNAMLESLEHAFLRQRRFVADASHELRTPVTVLRNKAEVALLSRRQPEEYERVLREVSGESERLSRLLGDLLLLARRDEGWMPCAQEPVHLNQLAALVVEYAQPLAEQRGIGVQKRTEEPVTIQGDEAQLIQVIMNLVENALWYTNAGGTVTVSVYAHATQARLEVQDTGEGIAAEHLPHVFERFYRGDQARQRTKKSGAGLGLSIAEGIVRAHGGTITVESQVGKGSMFTVMLPGVLTGTTSSLSDPAHPSEHAISLEERRAPRSFHWSTHALRSVPCVRYAKGRRKANRTSQELLPSQLRRGMAGWWSSGRTRGRYRY